MLHIDIDRLHAVAEGKFNGVRQKGHTLLSVTYLAGLVSNREPVIYCLIDRYAEASNVRTTVREVFANYKLPRINWIGLYHFTCNGSKVFFKNTYKNDEILMGIDDNVPIVLMFQDPEKEKEFITKYMI